MSSPKDRSATYLIGEGGQTHQPDAPEGKLVCDGLRDSGSQEGVARSAAEATTIATESAFRW